MIAELITAVALLGAQPEGALEISNVVVKDADTIKCTIMLPMDLTLDNQTIRAGDYDACESTKVRQAVAVTSDEVIIGKAAKLALIKLFAESEHDWFVPYKRTDKYGRRLGRLYAGDKPLAEWAEKNNYLRSQLLSKEKKP